MKKIILFLVILLNFIFGFTNGENIKIDHFNVSLEKQEYSTGDFLNFQVQAISNGGNISYDFYTEKKVNVEITMLSGCNYSQNLDFVFYKEFNGIKVYNNQLKIPYGGDYSINISYNDGINIFTGQTNLKIIGEKVDCSEIEQVENQSSDTQKNDFNNYEYYEENIDLSKYGLSGFNIKLGTDSYKIGDKLSFQVEALNNNGTIIKNFISSNSMLVDLLTISGCNHISYHDFNFENGDNGIKNIDTEFKFENGGIYQIYVRISDGTKTYYGKKTFKVEGDIKKCNDLEVNTTGIENFKIELSKEKYLSGDSIDFKIKALDKDGNVLENFKTNQNILIDIYSTSGCSYSSIHDFKFEKNDLGIKQFLNQIKLINSGNYEISAKYYVGESQIETKKVFSYEGVKETCEYSNNYTDNYNNNYEFSGNIYESYGVENFNIKPLKNDYKIGDMLSFDIESLDGNGKIVEKFITYNNVLVDIKNLSGCQNPSFHDFSFSELDKGVAKRTNQIEFTQGGTYEIFARITIGDKTISGTKTLNIKGDIPKCVQDNYSDYKYNSIKLDLEFSDDIISKIENNLESEKSKVSCSFDTYYLDELGKLKNSNINEIKFTKGDYKIWLNKELCYIYMINTNNEVKVQKNLSSDEIFEKGVNFFEKLNLSKYTNLKYGNPQIYINGVDNTAQNNNSFFDGYVVIVFPILQGEKQIYDVKGDKFGVYIQLDKYGNIYKLRNNYLFGKIDFDKQENKTLSIEDIKNKLENLINNYKYDLNIETVKIINVERVKILDFKNYNNYDYTNDGINETIVGDGLKFSFEGTDKTIVVPLF